MSIPQGDRRIRLLHFITRFATGGTERQLATLVAGLNRHRFDVRLACFEQTGRILADLDTGLPITVFPISALYHPRTTAVALCFARHLRRERIDVLHAHGFYPAVFALPAAWLARTPVRVAGIRDQGTELTPAKRLLQRVACRAATAIVANAEATRLVLGAQGYPQHKVTVIHNGVRVPNPSTQCVSLRAEMGWAPETPVIGMLSRVTPVKWVEGFMTAARAVALAFPAARFVVVGEEVLASPHQHGYRQQLEAHARDIGLGNTLVFLGLRTDISSLLPQFTISVLPSKSEGLSNALLESQAAAVPVVATRVGGNPEVVEDGVTGTLVPSQDAGALARAIIDLLANPLRARRMGAKGRARVVEHFSIERLVSQTEGLYASSFEPSRDVRSAEPGREAPR